MHESTICFFFFFNDTATTEIYTLSLHDALPIFARGEDAGEVEKSRRIGSRQEAQYESFEGFDALAVARGSGDEHFCVRSEEHTSELQSRQYLVCRLLLEKKKKNQLPLNLLHI